VNKSQAIKLLKDEGWTEADAKRALEVIDFNNNPDELTIRRTISSFAGPELFKRQRLQAAQKGMVTKKTKEIERKDEEYVIKINQYEESLKRAKEKYESEIQTLLFRKTDLETKVNSLAFQNNELLQANENLKKDKTVLVKVKEELGKDKAELSKVKEELEKDKAELFRVNEKLEKDKAELFRVNEKLKKDNKDLKNLVDAIKLRLAIDVKSLLRYEDSEIRKALVRLFKSTLG
jgi:chromosome segregation ATPase